MDTCAGGGGLLHRRDGPARDIFPHWIHPLILSAKLDVCLCLLISLSPPLPFPPQLERTGELEGMRDRQEQMMHSDALCQRRRPYVWATPAFRPLREEPSRRPVAPWLGQVVCRDKGMPVDGMGFKPRSTQAFATVVAQFSSRYLALPVHTLGELNR